MRSPPLSYLPEPRLRSSVSPSRIALPVGYSREAVVSFGLDAVLGSVPGRTYCIVSGAGGGRAVATSLDSSGQQACRFSQGQLEALGAGAGTQLRLFLANNLAADRLVRPLEDAHGLLNLVDTELTIELIDSPFFRPDAVIGVVSPAALFEGQQTIVEFSAKSRLSEPGAQFERPRELELWCQLYDTRHSSDSKRKGSLETQECTFTSSSLDAVRVKVASGSLRAGDYQLEVSLTRQMPSQIFETGTLRVLPAPRLRSVYPHYLEPQTIDTYGQVYLLGSGFLGLQGLNGTLRCLFSLQTEGRPSGAVATSHGRPAQVLSDRVMACPVAPTAARALGKHSQV